MRITVYYGARKDAEVELSISEVKKLYDLVKEIERKEGREQRRNVRRPRY